MGIKPTSRPQLSHDLVRKRMLDAGMTAPVAVHGIRGYYKNSMGKPGVNDRGIYDDAQFVVTLDEVRSFNGNTDPSTYRAGHGTGDAKGMAMLKPGLWTFTLGLHRGQYLALRQHGTFTVLRDGKEGPYSDTGDGFGINIHRGGHNGTSSLGCQTVVPEQYDEYISMVLNAVKKFYPKQDWRTVVIPYLLVEV